MPKLGPRAFEQCAGFLRVPESASVLDNTAVHPESYDAAKKLLALCGRSLDDVKSGSLGNLAADVEKLGFAKAAEQVGVGEPTLRDIVAELLRPAATRATSCPPPLLRSDVLSMEDLKPGMELTGTVRNVIDFGAFVDIGVHQDGLVHISRICKRFIKHPAEVLKVGDVVNVRVLDVDLKKKAHLADDAQGVSGGESAGRILCPCLTPFPLFSAVSRHRFAVRRFHGRRRWQFLLRGDPCSNQRCAQTDTAPKSTPRPAALRRNLSHDKAQNDPVRLRPDALHGALGRSPAGIGPCSRPRRRTRAISRRSSSRRPITRWTAWSPRLAEDPWKTGPELCWHAFARAIFESLDLKFDLDYQQLEELHWYERTEPTVAVDYMPELLDFLHREGIRTGVVSNLCFNEKTLRKRIDKCLPDHHFEFIMVSSEYALRKPMPEFYRLALTKAKLSAQDVWFCGDNAVCDVDGPMAAGIQGIWYTGAMLNPESCRLHPQSEGHLEIRDWRELERMLTEM